MKSMRTTNRLTITDNEAEPKSSSVIVAPNRRPMGRVLPMLMAIVQTVRPTSAVALKVNDTRLQRISAHVDQSQANWQTKPARPRTAWVQEQDARPGLDGRMVRVPADNGADAGSDRVQIKIAEIVQDQYPAMFEFHGVRWWKSPNPGAPVNVAPHRDHRGYLPQGIQNFWFPDVSRVNDQVRAPQGFDCLSPHQAMRVRNHADLPCFHVNSYSSKAAFLPLIQHMCGIVAGAGAGSTGFPREA